MVLYRRKQAKPNPDSVSRGEHSRLSMLSLTIIFRCCAVSTCCRPGRLRGDVERAGTKPFTTLAYLLTISVANTGLHAVG